MTSIKLPGLTIDCSNVRSVIDVASGGFCAWSGKVVLTFTDDVDGKQTVITANLSDTRLVDFEGAPEDGDPIYDACEMYAEDWANEIVKALGRPGYGDAVAA